jgi:hypothetical protein
MMMITMTLTFLMKQLRSQMIVTTMSLDPNIQNLPLIILLGHKSQGLHNYRVYAWMGGLIWESHYQFYLVVAIAMPMLLYRS